MRYLYVICTYFIRVNTYEIRMKHVWNTYEMPIQALW